MINSWLFIHCAAKAGAGDSNESPPAVVVDDQRTSAVSQASVHLASLVSSAEHLLVKLKDSPLVVSTVQDPGPLSPELGCSCLHASGCSPRF